MITGLLSAFSTNVADNPNIAAETKQQVQVQLSAGGSFVAADQIRTSATSAGLDPDTADEITSDYEDAQLKALKTAFLAAALLVLASFFATRKLPAKRFDELQAAVDQSERGT